MFLNYTIISTEALFIFIQDYNRLTSGGIGLRGGVTVPLLYGIIDALLLPPAEHFSVQTETEVAGVFSTYLQQQNQE